MFYVKNEKRCFLIVLYRILFILLFELYNYIIYLIIVMSRDMNIIRHATVKTDKKP